MIYFTFIIKFYNTKTEEEKEFVSNYFKPGYNEALREATEYAIEEYAKLWSTEIPDRYWYLVSITDERFV